MYQVHLPAVVCELRFTRALGPWDELDESAHLQHVEVEGFVLNLPCLSLVSRVWRSMDSALHSIRLMDHVFLFLLFG